MKMFVAGLIFSSSRESMQNPKNKKDHVTRRFCGAMVMPSKMLNIIAAVRKQDVRKGLAALPEG